MGNDRSQTRRSWQLLLGALALLPLSALADSGIYLGGSYGNAAVDANVTDLGFSGNFNKNDSAYKVFLGYKFDLPVVFLAIEGGYVDLGSPELTQNNLTVSVDPTGKNLWGIAGFSTGPIDLFLKAGQISWDADVSFNDGAGTTLQGSESGSDMGYGIGMAFGLGPIDVRGEYERYDIGNDKVSMVSVGLSFLFD